MSESGSSLTSYHMCRRYWDSSQSGVSKPLPLVVLAFFAPGEVLSVTEAVALHNPENGIRHHSSAYRTHSERGGPDLVEAVAEREDCRG